MSKPKDGLSVDGSCIRNPGPAEYQGVDIETGELILGYDIGQSSNNVAEFLAIVHAIKYCLIDGGMYNNIYTDSMTALWWIKKRKPNSKVENSALAEKMIDRSIAILDSLSIIGKPTDFELKVVDNNTGNSIYIKKWHTKKWGEIPADFGRK